MSMGSLSLILWLSSALTGTAAQRLGSQLSGRRGNEPTITSSTLQRGLGPTLEHSSPERSNPLPGDSTTEAPPATSIRPVSLFSDGQSARWSCYRAPALLNLGEGIILAFAHSDPGSCDSNPRAEAQDSVIAMRRSTDGGQTWAGARVLTNSTQQAAVFAKPQPVWDAQRSRVVLAFTAFRGNGSAHVPQIVQLVSDDRGLTFPGPLQLVSANFFASRYATALSSGGAGIQLYGGPHKGRLLFSGFDAYVTVWWSDDGGDNYNQTLLPNGASEMALAELSDPSGHRNGSVIGMIRLQGEGRHKQCQCKGYSISHDAGVTFSHLKFMAALPSPSCGAALLTLPGGELLFGGPGSAYLQSRLTLRLQHGDWNNSLADAGNWRWSHGAMLDPGTGKTTGGYMSLAPGSFAGSSSDNVLVLYEVADDDKARREGSRIQRSLVLTSASTAAIPTCLALGQRCHKQSSAVGLLGTCCSGVCGNGSTCTKEVLPPTPPPTPTFSGPVHDVFYPGLQPELHAIGMESCYRIPSLLFVPAVDAQHEGPAGRLVAVMESKHGHVCGDGVNSTLVMRTSTDKGSSWSAPSFPFKEYASNRKWGQPQMTYDRVTRTALLMFSNETLSKSPGGVQSLNSVLQIASTDGGLTWTPPDQAQNVDDKDAAYPSGPAPTSGNGIQLRPPHPHAGRLLWAMDTTGPGDQLLLSDNHGANYSRSLALDKDPAAKVDEFQLAQLSNGSVLAVLRNTVGDHRKEVALSTDGGVTFGRIRQHSDLLSPTCQGSVLYVGRSTVLFAGPRSTHSRVDMTVLASEDDGTTFNRSLLIWPKESMYSAMQLLPSGEVALLWERDGGNTSLVLFNHSELKPMALEKPP